MSEAQEHLSPEQIERLIAAQPEEPGVGVVPGALAEAQRHLAHCEHCQRLVRMHEEIARTLRRLAAAAPGPRGADCPEGRDLQELAAGLLPAGRAEALLDHAAGCPHCGPLLRQAVEDFSPDLNPEEEAMLEHLESEQPGFAPGLVRRLVAPEKTRQNSREIRAAAPARRGWTFWSAWAVAAAAIVLIVLGGVWSYRRTQPAYAEQLLAQAYSEQRSFELRIPGARPAPLRVERGGADRSNLSRPAALLEAEALIARELAKQPDDPRWLAERGHAELLDWQYEAAIKSFKRALEAQPGSPPLLRDLATAYFQRAEAQDRAIDYGEAIELLGEALAKQPDDPVALYNRAIAAEKMFLYQRAIEDWEHYLRVDPGGPWAGEARQRLDDLKKKLKAHEDARPTLLADPAAFAAWAASPAAAAPVRPDDSLDEGYLSLAVEQWLPALYRMQPPADGRPGAASQLERSEDHWRALCALADRLAARHKDAWLRELLAARPTAALAAGLAALASAVKADQAGDPSRALLASEQAGRLLASAGNKAGTLRSQLEQTYALHRSMQGDRCLFAAHSLDSALRGHAYSWIQGQLLIEESICLGMLGRFGESDRELAEGLRAARYGNEGTLQLRAAGMESGSASSRGNFARAWSTDRRGLRVYWAGQFPPIRAHQFYSDLAIMAESARQPQLAYTIENEAVHAMDATELLSGHAQAHYELARLAAEAGLRTAAEKEFASAAALYAGLPKTAVVLTYRAYGEMAAARFEARNGEFDRALARLDSVRADLPPVADDAVTLRFYQTLAQIELRRGNLEGSEKAIRSALAVTERELRSLATEAESLAWRSEVSDEYRLLVRLRLEPPGGPAAALDAWEWYRAAPLRGGLTGGASRPDSSPEARVNLIRSESIGPLPAIPPAAPAIAHLRRETVLSYAVFEDGIALWAFDDRGLHYHWSPVSRGELETQAQRFTQACAQRDADPGVLRAGARKLYDWLVAPAAPYLDPDRTLMIEPDGPIGQIPFQALIEPSGDYLGARLAMAWSPGLAYAKGFRNENRFPSVRRALIVASPAIGSGWAESLPALPQADYEAEIVAAHFANARVLAGKQATLDALERELAAAEIFHFAGHTLISGDSGMLLLAEQGAPRGGGSPAALNAAALKPAAVRKCHLVVLSACSTAADAPRLGDPNGLVGMFLDAGVPHVLASRWNVDSAATAAYMEAFYEALQATGSVPVAAQRAGARLRQDHATASPYYWAAFAPFGAS